MARAGATILQTRGTPAARRPPATPIESVIAPAW